MEKYLVKFMFLGTFLCLAFFSTNAVVSKSSLPQRTANESVDELTSEQIEKVKSILADYDKDNLTSEDAKAIFKELRKAKIPKGKGLDNAITEAGFDAKVLNELMKQAKVSEGGRGSGERRQR